MLVPNHTVALSEQTNNLNTGPFVDRVVYSEIRNPDQMVLAIQSGSIDMSLGSIDPQNYYSILDADPDIDIYSYLRNGYGQISINCAKYPLNIIGFRRAFAYAFDKTAVSDIMDNYSIEHDSLVPQSNAWCAESDFAWHYYTNQLDIGNQILDDLNFDIDPETGYRLAPDGSAFSIMLDYTFNFYSDDIDPHPMLIAQLGKEALQSLHVNVKIQYVDFSSYGIDLWGSYRNSYDMLYYARNFNNFDIEWLAFEFWGESVGVPYWNLCNFNNETYNNLRDKLLYSATYEEVYEAAAEMQKILHYNVPRLVIYENIVLQAYRNDKFTGHVSDLGNQISGPWTLRKIHKLDGTRGGTVVIGTPYYVNSFNIWSSSSPTSAAIFRELWPSLYMYGPDLTPQPYIAEKMLKETHADNLAVPVGHTRFTFDIIRNATWSDGVPLTADDVAFTLNYIIESGAYGNPAAEKLEHLFALYAPNPHMCVIEFSSESYWHFSHFAYQYIIPKHIFVDNIGYNEWDTWNPVFDANAPHVTAGPFLFTDFEYGEYYELTTYTEFAYFEPIVSDDTTPSSTTSIAPVTTPTSITAINGEQISPITLAPTLLIGFSSIVIIVMVSEIIRNKSRMKT